MTDLPEQAGPSRRQWGWGLAGILLLGLLLRLPNIVVPMFGDESMTVIANITKFFRERTILPEDVIYPTLYSYLEAVVLGGWSLALVLLGKAHTLAGAGLLFITDQAPLLPPLRLLTVAFDAGTMAAAWALGRRLRGARAGLLAALFVCLSMNHLRYARWALPDVPMAFLATCSLLCALKILEDPGWRWYLRAGALAGLAISTKYNAGTITVAIAAAHFLASGEKRSPLRWGELRKLLAAGGVCVAAFFAGSPVWLIQPLQTLGTFRETMAHMTGGHYFVPGGTPYWWIAQFLWREETAIGVVAAAGMIWALARHRRMELVLLAPIILSVAIIGAWQKQSPYYLLVIWPALLTLGAVFVDDAARLFRRPNMAALLMAALIGAVPVCRAAAMGMDSLREDNRVAAERWIQANLPQGARVGVDWGYMPALWDAGYMAEAEERRREQFAGSPDLEIWRRFAERTRSFHLVPVEYSTDWLKTADMDYIITSSMCYDRFVAGAVPAEGHPFREGYLAHRRFYEALFQDGPSARFVGIQEFGAGSGPVVRIYERAK